MEDISNRLQAEIKKRRKADDPPTKPAHLHDAQVARATLNVGKKVMKLAKLQIPEEGVDLGEAYASHFSVGVSNVQRTKRNGGGTKANETTTTSFSINIFAPGGRRALREALPALQQAAALDDFETNQHASPVKVSDGVTLIANQQQFDTYKDRATRKRAKPANEEQTDDQLNGKVHEQVHD